MKRTIFLSLFGLLAAVPAHAENIIGLGGKCLDVQLGGTENGTKVMIWDCTGAEAERWRVLDGTITGIGGNCLDVDGGATADGTGVHMWHCNPGAPNQRWTLREGQLIGIGGKCLDVTGGHATNGTPVILWTCTGKANQKWSILPAVVKP